MDVERRTSEVRSFVCKPEDLKRLVPQLEDVIGPVEFEAECRDEISRAFSSLGDLLEYENPKAREFVSLTLRATSEDRDARCRLQLSNSPNTSVRINLSGNENTVMLANRHIEDRLESMRPWYSRLAKMRHLWGLLPALLVGGAFLAVLGMVLFGVDQGGTQDEVSANEEARAEVIAYAVLFGSIVAGAGLDKLRDKIFPIGAFTIGQGRKRHALLEKIRWTVIVAFAVSLLAGLAVTWL